MVVNSMIDGDFGNVRRNYDCGNTDPELFEVKAVLVIERTVQKCARCGLKHRSSR